jgi:LytS/YehU family sensor histidine kinase
MIYWFATKFQINRLSWKKHIPLHLLLSVIISFLHNLGANGISLLVDQSENSSINYWRSVEYNLLTNLHWGLIIYWGVVAVSYSVNYYKKYHDTEMKAVQLSAQLSQAKLQALRMQLQPHFLFNTLNTISYYTYVDPKVSNRMVQLLSELLRMVLDQDQNERVPLRKEIDFLHKYLEIETYRFQDRLTIEWRIDAGVMDALIPSLILQPVIENSMRHGIAKLPAEGFISIEAQRTDSQLVLTVTDNGPGILQLENKTFREGIGLSNTRARLTQLYGERQAMKLMNQKPTGLKTEISIPYQEETELQA